MDNNPKIRKYLVYIALFCLLIPLVLVSSARAETQEVDLGDFVRIGIGARALAMSGAYVAIGGDSSSAFWNPAGMTELDRRRFGGMYTDRFSAGIIYQYLSEVGVFEFKEPKTQTASQSLSSEDGFLSNLSRYNPLRGKLGLGLTRIGMDIGELAYSIGNPVGESRVLWLGSTAYRFPEGTILDGFSLGANLKHYRRTLNEESATGWGYDLGMLYKTPVGPEEFPLFGRVGFSLQDPSGVDIVPGDDVDIEGSGVIPPYTRAGIAFGYNSDIPVLISAEYDFSPTRPQLNRMSIGTEVSFANMFSFRVGLNSWLREERIGYTTGAGFKIGQFSIDYAFLPHVALATTHVLSLDYKF